MWKLDLTDKRKSSFFQAAVVSILLYGCTTWTLTKRLEKKLDGKYTRILRAILNKSWRQHPTKHQLYGHLPPITKTIQVRRTRYAGHCWRSKDELISDNSYGPPHRAKQKQDDQRKHTYNSYVRIRDVALKTGQKRWMIGRSGERESGISVLAARHDDNDDFKICWINSNSYHCYHYPLARLLTQILLTFSRYPSPSVIALSRSSKLYPVSTVFAYWYTLVQLCVEIQRRMLFMSLFLLLLLQHWPACLVHYNLMF